VLACYELWFGERRWKRLIPFFAVALAFGLQGLFFNPNVENDYTLRLTPLGLWKSVSFYSSQVFLLPFAGLALLGVPFLVRDKRVRFGIFSAALVLAPLLLLPNRIFGAYLYLPLALLAAAFPAVETRLAAALAGAFFAVWIFWNHVQLRAHRRATLAIADENRSYVAQLGEMMRVAPDVHTFIYDGAPPEMHRWGVEGAVRWFARPGVATSVYPIDDRDLKKVFDADALTLFYWDSARRHLGSFTRHAGEHDASHVTIGRASPIWQLGEGWFQLENRYRWIGPRATARLYRPPEARRFELGVNVGEKLIQDVGRTEVTVLADGQEICRQVFDQPGPAKTYGVLKPAPAGVVTIEFRVQPGYRPTATDPRVLGVAITSFGFLTPPA
jgi:hypothetical protein